MNKNLFKFFVVFSFFVTLGVLAGSFWIFSTNRSTIEEVSASSVRSISRSLSTALGDGIYPGTNEFSRAVDSFFDQYSNLLTLTIYSPEKGVYYSRSLKRGILSPDISDTFFWSGRPTYTSSAGSLITKSAPLSFSLNSTRLIVENAFSAGLTVLNYKKALTIFFAYSAYLIMIIFLLIIFRQADGLPETLSPEVLPVPGPVEYPPVGIADPAASPMSETAGAKDNANCLYSPTTGMVRKDLLEDKLNQELKRSAAFDQDLVLTIFSLRGLEKQENIHRFQSIVLESFPYRDLVFDYEENCFALIMPNIELDASVAPLENFQLKTEKSNLSPVQKFSAGVSSRSGRLLTSRRLITEAYRAYSRAKSEKNGGIILFRISPKKYRQVVSERNF